MSPEEYFDLMRRCRRLQSLRESIRMLMIIPLGLSFIVLVVQIITGHWTPDASHLISLGWFAIFSAGLIVLCYNLIRIVDIRLGRYQEQTSTYYASLPDTVPLEDQTRMQRSAASIVACYRRRPRLLRDPAVADVIDQIERFAAAMDRHDGPSDTEITNFQRDILLPMERQVRTIRSREQLVWLFKWYLVAVLVVFIIILLFR